MRRILAPALAALALAAPATAGLGDPQVAALQVGLKERRLYAGPVDGVLGPKTSAAVQRLQRRARIVPDGLPGPQTRAALGRFGAHPLGSRTIGTGMSGWDVAVLQFSLAWHGFPSGVFDGDFGPRTQAALTRFQEWAGLPPAGHAGARTLAALREPPATSPLQLAWPLGLPVTDTFGPRGDRFHAGIDIPAAYGKIVRAAASGWVVYAGWRDGGWGNQVTVAHASGVRTIYAHLLAVDVELGDVVTMGTPVGQVGASGSATGPHLHFEVRLRGAAVDPLTALRN
ncbi:MAG: peptidoglycan DD-metalloendopeptidase family protein [Gaiellaceae bacterium]